MYCCVWDFSPDAVPSLEGEESVVYVGKKGVIESLDVESLDQSYYDETELKSYVDAEVKDYTAEHGKKCSRGGEP